MTDVTELGHQHAIGARFRLDGRAALVTGGRQGIGAAVARAFAEAGADVAVTSRDAGALTPLLAELESLGVGALGLSLDVTDPSQIEAAVEASVDSFGRLDILVNNAGVSIRGPSTEYRLEDWDQVLNTNLRGTFLAACSAARHMHERKSGRVINLSSPFARVGLPLRAAYAASKAGVEALTRSLAVEWASAGITVNALAPSTIVTETREALFSDQAARDERISQIPLGRLGRAEDVTGAALLLAGEAGSFITGQTLLIDGGYVAAR